MNKKSITTLLSLINSLHLELENNQMKDMFKLNKKNRDKVLNTVADTVLNYTVDDNVLSLTTKERVLLKKELSGLVKDIAESEYQSEKAIFEELLKTSAAERYYINSYFYSRSFNINYSLKKLSDKEIKNVIDAKVQGKAWSERLWKNKRGLEKTLRKELYNLVDGKTDINKISREVSKRYSQSYSNSRRLARTEGARVQESINETWASTHKIEKQMFIGTLDNRTSQTCIDKDSTIWNIDDANKPVPPLHCNCRSTLINLPDIEGYKPSMRRDNITGENIDYVSYKEWKENQ